MAQVETMLLSELLQWYRLQRHDFLNHWQVIMGNLQLNQPEKALAYMRETVAASLEEQKLAQIPESGLAAILLGFIIRLRLEGITASIDFPEEMQREDFWQVHWQEEYVEGLYGYTRECLEVSSQSKQLKDLISEVYLYDEPGGFSCQYILSDEETVLYDKTVRFTKSPEIK
ncbi:Spo0B domain-containing protein [Desulfosporosinus sp. Sb-LF]|uniref:Spo0B domain-containing protein n=1 Tax=Desulfosporosinus sp. Sb-LF TaxID=2560027 RepID=UPI00107F1830|nr:Spo0B domain-containing protein [Desulfosporosinus sp. Sb-LF]TGE31856.1 histidine kinase [Desulfosporosinus sp. Sb-LF]